MWIFVALIAVPIIEIGLFIQIGGAIGLWPTLALVVLSAVIGGTLLRQQGLATIEGLRGQMARGGDPSPLLVQGALLLVGGVLLLTPGFFTDAIGLALLIPPLREALVAWAGPRILARVVTIHPGQPQRASRRGPSQFGDDAPIDVDYREVDPPTQGSH